MFILALTLLFFNFPLLASPVDRSLANALTNSVEKPLDRSLANALTSSVDKPLDRALENSLKKSLNIVTRNKPLEARINKHFNKPEKFISRENLRRYLIKNSYYQFQIQQLKNQYRIDNPIETIFIIKGAKSLTDYGIQSLINNDTYQTDSDLHRSVQANIKQAYIKKGFQEVRIQRRVKKKNWKEWVYFEIEEGKKIRLGDIKIQGNFSKPPKQYINFILNNSSPLIKKGFFNKKDLEIGYKNLLGHLRTQGFLQSNIYPNRITIKNSVAYVQISIEEGALTIIKNISFVHSNILLMSDILSIMKSKIQSSLNLVLLEEDLTRIEDFYRSKGFLQVQIKDKNTIINYQTNDKKYANLVISIDEGVKSNIASIKISGLSKVKKSLVVKLLKFKIGEVLTPKKINQSKQALSRSGLFSQISINPLQVESKTAVIIKLKEKKPRSLRGGVGINTERALTTRTYLEFSYNNLLGWGRSLFLNTSGQVSLYQSDPFLEYKVTGGYKEIFAAGKNYEGHINLSQSKDIFNYSLAENNAVRTTELNIFIDKRFDKDRKLTWNLYNFENRKESCISASSCLENLQQIGSSGFSFQWDSRDNILNPQNGGLLLVSGEWASPYFGSSKDIDYLKLHFQNQFYFSFLSKYTLAFALKGGLINATDTIPVSQAFILGGQSSVRGYDGNIEGDRIPSQSLAPIQTANEPLRLQKDGRIEKVSTNRYGLIKTELRFPISKNFKGLLFYDAALIYMKGKQSQAIEYGHSTGIGVRYETFLLPIGLDIAYKLPPKQGAEYRFHFSVGFF